MKQTGLGHDICPGCEERIPFIYEQGQMIERREIFKDHLKKAHPGDYERLFNALD